ncbi:S8 family serine peptidase [Chitinivorax sp. PXF-14]|uniref:S8 family serine peptidase n=1 Tax=Chitinivorax sp. PXF-14 TaxID=3230488 RepID=UPI0034667769
MSEVSRTTHRPARWPARAGKLVLALMLSASLASCGGGGGGGGGDKPPQNDKPAPQPSPQPQPTPQPTPAPSSATLRGEITAGGGAVSDWDSNDPNAPSRSNDTLVTAQPIPNPATVGGYVNEALAGKDGRSHTAGDVSDVFKVSLTAGQAINLVIGDETSGDLDLGLIDSQGNLVASSEGVGKTESLTVPASGSYYLWVYAASGASTYVMTVGLGNAGTRQLSRFDSFVPGELILKPREGAARASSVRAQAAGMGMAIKAGGGGREMLVGIGSTAAERQRSLKALGVVAGDIKRATAATLTPTGAANTALAARLDTIRAIKAWRKRPDVQYAEPNYLLRTSAVPDDKLYGYQWHYPQINLPQAWDITTGSNRVIVAVVDSGVVLSHPDLQGQLVAGYDFVSNTLSSGDGDGLDADPNDPGPADPASSGFHGTHVTGTIAARSNNGMGVAGVAWNAKVMPVRVLGNTGAGSLYDIMQGVRYAAGLPNDSGTVPAQAAQVINLSLGGGGYSQATQDVFSAVRQKGIIVVAAAGNEASSQPSYPASYDGVVSVSATDMNRELAPYSNYGAHIDVAAPGGNAGVDVNGDGVADGVLSTVGDISSGQLEYKFAISSGTSMASPHVAGVVALMKSVNPGLTPAQFDQLLQSGRITTDLGAPGRDDRFGWGLIDAYKAVVEARKLAGGNTTPQPAQLVASPASVNLGSGDTSFTLSLRNAGDGTLSIGSVSSSAAWLSITPAGVDGGKVGSYTLVANRAGLADGTYQAVIHVVSSAGNLDVPVIMQKSSSVVSGDAGYLYVLLIDPVSRKALKELAVLPQNGRYRIELGGVAPGDYYVLAGSDINNDGYVCDVGEACAAYPTLSQPALVTVSGDRDNLNFIADFNLAFSSNSVDPGRAGRFERIRLPSAH